MTAPNAGSTPAPVESPVVRTDEHVDLDDVVNSPYDHSSPRPTTLFQSPDSDEGRRTQGLVEAISSIEASSGSTRDRLLLNTIKKLSREMKRKEEEMEKREREWEKAKVKNEELQRRIRNAKTARAAAGGARGAGRKPALPTKNNATPLGKSTSPN